MLVEGAGGAVLGDAAGIHDDDAVGDGQGFLLVVGDVDHGQAQRLLEGADLLAHVAAQLGVQVGQRLVEQQHLRLQHDGAGHRHALLLAAGEFAGQARLVAGEADQGQLVAGLALGLGLADPRGAGRP